MEYVAAYSLITKTTSEELGADKMKKKIVELLNSINAPVCEESLDLFISKINGRSMSEIIAAGSELMKSQISTGASSNAGAASSAAAAAPKQEEEEESEEADLDFF